MSRLIGRSLHSLGDKVVERCGWAKSKENWAYENMIERVTVGKDESWKEEEIVVKMPTK